jgi:outer membrane receptor protein involved in Fe transport
MKQKFLLFAITLLAGSLLAQFPDNLPKGNSRIKGIVMDSLDNIPVQFATIALMDPTTNKPIDGTVADDNGKFELVKVATGEFDVVISFVGYLTKTFHVSTSEKREEVDLGTIKLSFEAAFLNDVVVEGERAIFEERVDRTVYNAENDKTTAGGDASDVLRRVPMLSVDLDGNVSMRGNDNVRVLINNKPSTIMASSVSDALKQIPADMIKSVEVITSPSAKYDAEGSAGIINIITKKNNLQGLTMNINAGAGLRGSNLGLNGNYRKGKMGFSLGGFGRAGYNVRGSSENTQIRDTYDYANTYLGSTTNIQSSNTLNQNMFGRYQFGWDYDINKNNMIAASVRYGVRNGRNFQNDLSTKTYDINDNLTETLKQIDVTDNSGTVDLNLDYTHYYKKPQQELTFLALYSRNNRTNDFETITEVPALSARKNNNLSFNEEITIQADYQSPIGTTQMVELGGKNISRIVSSEYQYFDLVNGAYVESPASSLSNTFNYNQNVSAGYLSYTYNSKSKYSFKAGGRYEYTTINANFAQIDAENPDVGTIDPYGVFVPSLNISRKLKAGNTIKAAYNKRIQRPSIQFLNPNIQAANPLQVSQGNPNLNPEYTDNYELSYSQFIKGTTLNFSGFFRNTTGAIQRYSYSKGDTLFSSYQNLGTERAYGLNFFGNVSLSKKISINGGTDVYYADLNNNMAGDLNVRNSGWVVSGRLFGNYNMNNGWGLQLFTFMRGNRVNLQGYQGGFRMYGLNVRKEIYEKRGSIGFGFENFLANGLTIKSATETRTYNINDYTMLNQNSTNVMKNMNVKINFSYRIGKMGFEENTRRAPRRRRSVNNDDLKEGGDGNNAGGMEMGEGGAQQQMNGRQGARQGAAATQTKTPEVSKKKAKKESKKEKKKSND